jgi:hypothetical protein
LATNTASADAHKPLSSKASAGIALAVLFLALAIISAIVWKVKQRTEKRKSQVLDAWIKALEEKQSEARAAGVAPTVIEGVTVVPPKPAESYMWKPKPALDQEMLNQISKGPYGSVYRPQRTQRGVRFSVHADHGPE